MSDDTEDQFIDGYFNQTDLELQPEEFEVAIKSMKAAKIIQEVQIKGQTYYQLTAIGRAIGRHRYHSNSKDQN